MRHGLNLIQTSETENQDEDGSQGIAGSVYDTEQKSSSKTTLDNQGSLRTDATCAPVDSRYPTDRSLLNVDEVFSEGVAREVTEVLIDSMVKTVLESFDHKPRSQRKQSRQ